MRKTIANILAASIAGVILAAPIAWALTAVFPQDGGTGNNIYPAKGDVLAGSATSYNRVAVGSDGRVLTASSGAQFGVAWSNSGSADGSSNFSWYDANTISPSSMKGVLVQTEVTSTNITVTSINGLVRCNGEARCAAGVSGTDYDTAAAWNTNANATSYVSNYINASGTLPKIISGGLSVVPKVSGDVLVSALTSDLAEGTNLYYTPARSVGSISGFLNDASATSAKFGSVTSSTASTSKAIISTSATFGWLADGLLKVVSGALQVATVTTDYLTQASNAVLSGTWDFGGAPSVEIPNAAAPTVDADGEVALDTTKGQFLYSYNGEVQVLSPTGTRCAVIENLAAADDNISLGSFAASTTITAIWSSYNGTGTTLAEVSLEDGGGNAMTHGVPYARPHGTTPTSTAVTAGNTLEPFEVLRFDVDNAVSPETDEYDICVAYKQIRL